MDGNSSSFCSTFERWYSRGRQHGTEIERQLERTYRAAWLAGDLADRTCVLSFILFSEQQDALDIVIDGLKDDRESIASFAVGVATEFIRRDFTLAPGLREALKELPRRFPSQPAMNSYALMLLDRKETRRKKKA